MIYPARDEYVGRSLALYGEFSPGEADIFQALVSPRDIVVEVGANIGVHTVLLARLVGLAGAVLAFEPQPMLFQTLCANLALNSIFNVRTERFGLGNRTQTLYIPLLDYGSRQNFGGLSLDLVDDGIAVPVKRLDAFNIQHCSLIKIDVEGMEHQVIEGAANTIHTARPVLYVENDRKENSPELIRLLLSMDYLLWWHVTPLFKKGNFAGNDLNVFGGTVSINLLCIPSEKMSPKFDEMVARMGMLPVAGAEDWWRSYPELYILPPEYQVPPIPPGS
jgi:FkbM family methyltransferase